MQPRLTALNFNEVLLYLGYRGQSLDAGVEAQIRQCMKKVEATVRPLLVYRRVPVVDGGIPLLPLEGKDLKELLSSSEEAVVMAVTLGADAERLLREATIRNMADAVIIDSAESTAIENVANNFESDLRAELEKDGLFLTDRFSPGYGDLPLDSQRSVAAFLDAERRIGLTVTPTSMMIPSKSVTAVMGIARTEQKLRKKGCEQCAAFRSCQIRKEGKVCHE